MRNINKFGTNPACGTGGEDIWDVGGVETLPTAGVSHSMSSEAAGQTQTIRIQGLDGNWEFQSVDVALNGQNKAAIGTFSRIFRAYQVSSGATPTGDVWIYETDDTVVGGVPQTASKIHGYLDTTSRPVNQTRKASYTVPANKKVLVYSMTVELGSVTSGSARTCGVSLKTSQLGIGADRNNPAWTPFRERALFTVSTVSAISEHQWRHPVVCDELTDIKAFGVGTADCDVSVDLHMLEVPWNYS
jgi:hypothetical protein